MTQKDDGGPAFPVAADEFTTGMSLRDWVMGQCVAAAFGGIPQEIDYDDEEQSEAEAVRAYWDAVAAAAAIAADAMIAAREAKP